MRKRLQTSRHLAAASRFDDRRTMECAVSGAMELSSPRIARWLADVRRPHVNLRVRCDVDIGDVLVRGLDDTMRGSEVRVLLRRSEQLGIGYVIHTAYVDL
jgi:hypothetical protein